MNNTFENELNRISLQTNYNWKLSINAVFTVEIQVKNVTTIAIPKHTKFDRVKTLNLRLKLFLKYYIHARYTTENIIST